MKIRYRYLSLAILVILVLLFNGCGDNKITGKVTSELGQKTIRDGGTTDLIVNGENTGKVEANVQLQIIPEDSEKVIVTYPGSLEDTLQPGEEIGRKIVKIQGFTDYTKTEYKITVNLVNKDSGAILDKKVNSITVVK